MIGTAIRPPRPIALVGLPGTGKTTLGRHLAQRLGWEMRDTDEEIERTDGRTPLRIIEDDGEEAFRRLEVEVVAGLLAGPRPLVIACGGGLFADEAARRMLLQEAWVVALDADDAILLERLGTAGERPLLRGDVPGRLRELRRQREAAYGRAHLRLDTGCTTSEAAVTALCRVADSIGVPLGARAYPVVVGEGAADHLEIHLPAACRRAVVVADRRVEPLGRRLAARLHECGRDASLVTLRGGETVKSWATAGRLLERLAGLGVGRRDALIAVGGGTVGDMAGFAAAAYCRGIAWVVVPTTLLAMVDSAVGGKTAVNLRAAKNMVGAFWQPRAVLADPTLLDTLPEREMASGLAEVAKYAMIAPTDLPDLLDAGVERVRGGDVHALTAIVERCASIKAEVVGADPGEAGLRAILNYGHTAAHAVEVATGYGPVTHGEAVAVGMRIAGRLSTEMLGMPLRDLEWQDRLLDRLGLPALPPIDPAEVLKRLGHDKKAVGGEPRWVLLSERGAPRVDQRVPAELVRETVTEVLRGDQGPRPQRSQPGKPGPA